MKIAIFKNLEFGFETPSTDDLDDHQNYIRLTEYADVEFTPLDNGELTNKQIDFLKAKKKEIQAETEIKLNKIDVQISKLLALPHSAQE